MLSHYSRSLIHLTNYSLYRVRKATQIASNPVVVSENIINSLYIKFTTREVNYYITEADIFNVFSLFGTVTTVNIKDLNIDQSMQRQTGYGFVHFIGDREGTEQAMRACNTLNRSSRNGIFFNVELSKNFMKQFGGNRLDLPGSMCPAVTVHNRHPLGEFRADARSVSHPLMTTGGVTGYDQPMSYQHPLMQDTLSVASSGSGGRLPTYRAGRTSDPMSDSSVASGGSTKKYDTQLSNCPTTHNYRPGNSMAPRSNFGWLTGAMDSDVLAHDARLDTISHNFSTPNFNSF